MNMGIMKSLDSHAIKVFFALIALVVSASLFSPDAFAQTGFEKAPPTVLDEISLGRHKDIIVLFDDKIIRDRAAALVAQKSLAENSHAITSFKAEMFEALKQDVLSFLPAGEFDVLRYYSHLPMVFLRIKSLPALERLLEQGRVLIVYEEERYRHFLSQSLPLIRQPQVASQGKIGTGTTVAVLDTGVDYTRSAFGACTTPVPAFCSDTNPPSAPAGCKVACVRDFTPTNDNSLDDNGHGTNVSGIVLGVAPDTRIAGLDVFRTDGFAYSSDIIAAINWCIANKTTYNIVAINMSLGGGGSTSPCSNSVFSTPISDARSAGIISAVASGNDGSANVISEPACAPSAVSVGAVYDSNIGGRIWSVCMDLTTFADKVVCFSNSASFLTMLAPGCTITAANLSMCGTSMAAPHIAGSAAVLKGTGAFPSETPDQTITRMTSTGVPVTDPKNAITKPRIDLLAAVGGGGGGGTYSISGKVTIIGGLYRGGSTPLSGVTMTLSDAASATTTTDANGNYTFAGLSNGTYTITPSRTGYSFTPASRAVTINNANLIGQSFAARFTGFSISGTITSGGNPLVNVMVNLTGTANATTTTNDLGVYTFTGLANGGSYTVTPSQAGFIFTPTNRAVTINNANVTGQDFVGTAVVGGFSISGTVRALVSRGAPVPGVTMTLSGQASATTTTDGSGNYSFSGLANGSYTVTPSQTGRTFTPVSRVVTINNANVTGQNFTRN